MYNIYIHNICIKCVCVCVYIYIYKKRNHFVHLKLTQHCKLTILQFKNDKQEMPHQEYIFLLRSERKSESESYSVMSDSL